MSETLMVLFLVAFIGYLVGSITIKGVELGTAGVLIVALVFGPSVLLPGRSSSGTLRSMQNPISCWASSLSPSVR